MNTKLHLRYVLASVGLMAIASANGAIRELTYGRLVSETAAHALSLVPMAILFGLYVLLLQRRWPLPTWRDALGVGLVWAAIAAAFDLGLGHFVEGKSWSELLDLDLVVVLATSAAVPGVVRGFLRAGPATARNERARLGSTGAASA